MTREHVYSRTVVHEFETGDETVLKSVDYPNAGAITAVKAKQLSGTSTGFTLYLYNKEVDLLDSDIFLYEIWHSSAVMAGGELDVIPPDTGWPFRNVEGGISVPVKKIYVVWAFAAPLVDDCSFALTLSCIPFIN